MNVIVSYLAVLSIMHCMMWRTEAHSWLECTDYRMEQSTKATEFWDKDVCQGNARCGAQQAAAGFGIDTGFDFRGPKKCQCDKAPSNYEGIKMAKYEPGQRVCLAYPSKNHVAAKCTNPDIPDTGVVITRYPMYEEENVLSTYPNLNGVHEKGVIDYKGFQHCPKFCDNPGLSLCTLCFQLENDIAPGNYTFRWLWQFNSKEDVYASCWEAEVIDPKSKMAGPSTPSPTPSPVPSVSDQNSTAAQTPPSYGFGNTTKSPDPSGSGKPGQVNADPLPSSPTYPRYKLAQNPDHLDPAVQDKPKGLRY